jgi:hypothetical protein
MPHDIRNQLSINELRGGEVAAARCMRPQVPNEVTTAAMCVSGVISLERPSSTRHPFVRLSDY